MGKKLPWIRKRKRKRREYYENQKSRKYYLWRYIDTVWCFIYGSHVLSGFESDLYHEIVAVVLIALGIEMIAANLHQRAEDVQVLKYDKGAVVMIILLSCFAMVMGVIEYCMEYYSRYGYIYIS